MMPGWNQMRPSSLPGNQGNQSWMNPDQMMGGGNPMMGTNPMMGGFGMDPSYQMGGQMMYQQPYMQQQMYQSQMMNQYQMNNQHQMNMMMQPAPPPNQPPGLPDQPPAPAEPPPSKPSAPPPPTSDHSTESDKKSFTADKTELQDIAPDWNHTSGENPNDALKRYQDQLGKLMKQGEVFEMQYSEWHKQFDEWKMKHKNHPNKAQFVEYEKQWVTWQEQMLGQKKQNDANKERLLNNIKKIEQVISERKNMKEQQEKQKQQFNQQYGASTSTQQYQQMAINMPGNIFGYGNQQQQIKPGNFSDQQQSFSSGNNFQNTPPTYGNNDANQQQPFTLGSRQSYLNKFGDGSQQRPDGGFGDKQHRTSGNPQNNYKNVQHNFVDNNEKQNHFDVNGPDWMNRPPQKRKMYDGDGTVVEDGNEMARYDHKQVFEGNQPSISGGKQPRQRKVYDSHGRQRDVNQEDSWASDDKQDEGWIQSDNQWHQDTFSDQQHSRFDKDNHHNVFNRGRNQQRPTFQGNNQQHPRFSSKGQQRPRFPGSDQQKRLRFPGSDQQKRPRFTVNTEQRPRFPGNNQQRPRFPGNNQQRPRFPGNNQERPRFPGNNQERPRFPGSNQERSRFPGNNQQRPRFPVDKQKWSVFTEDDQEWSQFTEDDQKMPEQMSQFSGDVEGKMFFSRDKLGIGDNNKQRLQPPNQQAGIVSRDDQVWSQPHVANRPVSDNDRAAATFSNEQTDRQKPNILEDGKVQQPKFYDHKGRPKLQDDQHRKPLGGDTVNIPLQSTVSGLKQEEGVDYENQSGAGKKERSLDDKNKSNRVNIKKEPNCDDDNSSEKKNIECKKMIENDDVASYDDDHITSDHQQTLHRPGNNQQRPGFLGNNQQKPRFPGNNQQKPRFPGNDQQRPRFPGNNQQRPRFPGNVQQRPHFPGNDQQRPRFPGNDQQRPHFPGNDQQRPRFPGNDQQRPRFPGNDQKRPRFLGDDQTRHRFPGESFQRRPLLPSPRMKFNEREKFEETEGGWEFGEEGRPRMPMRPLSRFPRFGEPRNRFSQSGVMRPRFPPHVRHPARAERFADGDEINNEFGHSNLPHRLRGPIFHGNNKPRFRFENPIGPTHQDSLGFRDPNGPDRQGPLGLRLKPNLQKEGSSESLLGTYVEKNENSDTKYQVNAAKQGGASSSAGKDLNFNTAQLVENNPLFSGENLKKLQAQLKAIQQMNTKCTESSNQIPSFQKENEKHEDVEGKILQKAKTLSSSDIKNILSAMKFVKATTFDRDEPSTSKGNPQPGKQSSVKDDAEHRSAQLLAAVDVREAVDKMYLEKMNVNVTADLGKFGVNNPLLDPLGAFPGLDNDLLQEYLKFDPLLEEELLQRIIEERELLEEAQRIDPTFGQFLQQDQIEALQLLEQKDFNRDIDHRLGNIPRRGSWGNHDMRPHAREPPVHDMRPHACEPLVQDFVYPPRDDERWIEGDRSSEHRSHDRKKEDSRERSPYRDLRDAKQCDLERQSIERRHEAIHRDLESVKQRRESLDNFHRVNEVDEERNRRERSLERLRRHEHELHQRERDILSREQALREALRHFSPSRERPRDQENLRFDEKMPPPMHRGFSPHRRRSLSPYKGRKTPPFEWRGVSPQREQSSFHHEHSPQMDRSRRDHDFSPRDRDFSSRDERGRNMRRSISPRHDGHSSGRRIREGRPGVMEHDMHHMKGRSPPKRHSPHRQWKRTRSRSPVKVKDEFGRDMHRHDWTTSGRGMSPRGQDKPRTLPVSKKESSNQSQPDNNQSKRGRSKTPPTTTIRPMGRPLTFADLHKPPGNESSKPPPMKVVAEPLSHNIEDIINMPGRLKRPNKIVVILRGLPGCGKTHVAKMIRDKESGFGVSPRVLGLDDYFMSEVEKTEKDPDTGKIVKKRVFEYEYEEDMEPSYRENLIKLFKKTLDDGYFSFVVMDSINNKVEHFAECYNIAKLHGFEVYIAEIKADIHVCARRNTHERPLADIQRLQKNWDDTPAYMNTIDLRQLIQDSEIQEVEMGDITDSEDETQEVKTEMNEESPTEVADIPKSKWENDPAAAQLDKLDGISKKSAKQRMDDFLCVTEDYNTRHSEPGKKRVRWADINERQNQQRMRDVGFVVGQTDWSRMMDDSHATQALNRTKFI